MISYDEAIGIVQEQAAKCRLAVEDIPLSGVSGRLCAEDIKAPSSNQPFDNSAMDGFALHAEDLEYAVNDNPVALEMAAHIAAGDGRAFGALARGQCYEIMTGAPLPPGCDAVVPVEKTSRDGARVIFRETVKKNENIRRAGEDFKVGDTVLDRGRVLDAGHILALATLGIGRARVFKRPSVALISTGREVVDDLSASLAPGQIYNSTKPYLEAALVEAGVELHSYGTVMDDPADFKKKIQCMIDNKIDIGVSTGAVSAGVHDFVPSVLKEMGAEILFHKVSIRPGKPLLFAQLPGGALFFGLPGNPVASAAGLRFFVQPALRAMHGLPPEEVQYAFLAEPYKKKHPLRHFARARVSFGKDFALHVNIPQRQQSFMVRQFTNSNAWAVIPEEAECLAVGEKIQVFSDNFCAFCPGINDNPVC